MASHGGIWLVQFESRFGQGMAMLVFSDGNITGAGSRGGLWDGTYTVNESTGNLDVVLTVRFAKGVVGAIVGLVGGAENGETYRFSVPSDASEYRLPSLPTLLGPINAVMRKLRALP